jgi:hypothetical protein
MHFCAAGPLVLAVTTWKDKVVAFSLDDKIGFVGCHIGCIVAAAAVSGT